MESTEIANELARRILLWETREYEARCRQPVDTRDTARISGVIVGLWSAANAMKMTGQVLDAYRARKGTENTK